MAHYLIHSYDAPPIASKGLVAARRYAGIAPDAPHALHMPSHIFNRVGSWEEYAATNLRWREVERGRSGWWRDGRGGGSYVRVQRGAACDTADEIGNSELFS